MMQVPGYKFIASIASKAHGKKYIPCWNSKTDKIHFLFYIMLGNSTLKYTRVIQRFT